MLLKVSMALRHTRHSSSGTTLMDVMMAISLNAVAIGAIFMLSRMVLVRIHTANRKATQNADIVRVTSALSRTLQRSRQVIEFTPSSIRVDAAGEAVTYSFAHGRLTCNGHPIVFMSDLAVAGFGVRSLGEPGASTKNERDLLLEISIVFTAPQEERRTCTLQCALRNAGGIPTATTATSQSP